MRPPNNNQERGPQPGMLKKRIHIRLATAVYTEEEDIQRCSETLSVSSQATAHSVTESHNILPGESGNTVKETKASLTHSKGCWEVPNEAPPSTTHPRTDPACKDTGLGRWESGRTRREGRGPFRRTRQRTRPISEDKKRTSKI